MKLKETLLYTQPETSSENNFDEVGDDHVSNSIETPIRKDAFDISNEKKKEIISEHFKVIMETLGLDLTDDSLKGTPYRVAKMYVEEIFSGLNQPINQAALLKTNINTMRCWWRKILLSILIANIICPHLWKIHVTFLWKVIGLSKINRIVDYFARRPQVQERLTNQIGNDLKEILGTEDVAVIIDAKHLCVSSEKLKTKHLLLPPLFILENSKMIILKKNFTII